jgi:hypothetical protein
MIFSEAYILGVQRRGGFFGENVGRYRSIDTISIEGYIDVRNTNNDLKGVRESLVDIQNYVNAANSLSDVVQPIVINGSGFGSGKILNLEFPASESFDENQVKLGKYSAEIETYTTAGANGSAILESSLPYEEFIEELSEDFKISLDEENVYSFDHSVGITYMSGVTDNGISIDPISGAKEAAYTLFNQVPTKFSTLLPGSVFGLASQARRFYTESYDLCNGNCSFGQRFKINPQWELDYASKVTTSLQMNEKGIMTVTEQGEISPRAASYDAAGNVSYLETVIDAAHEQIDSYAYTRCNTQYNKYKNTLGINSGALHSTPITITKNIDSSAASLSYTIVFTDQNNIETFGGGQYVTRTITVDRKNDNVTTVSEEGQITFRGANSQNSDILNTDPKFGSDFWGRLPSRSTAKARCVDAYQKAYPQTTETLRNISNKFSVKAYKNNVTYNYVFSDDKTINDYPEYFAQFSLKSDDKIGVVNQSKILIPNQPLLGEFVHQPGQTSLGTRTSKVDAIIRRKRYDNMIADIPAAMQSVAGATANAKPIVLRECLMFRADNPAIYSPDTRDQYVSNASYSYSSDYTYNMSMELTYVMERTPWPTNFNLALPGSVGR